MAGGLAVIVVVMLLALVIGLRLWSLRLRDQRRDTWRNQPFPTDWHDIIKQRVPFVTRLPEELQQQLQDSSRSFWLKRNSPVAKDWKSQTRSVSPLPPRPVSYS